MLSIPIASFDTWKRYAKNGNVDEHSTGRIALQFANWIERKENKPAIAS